MGVNAFRVSKCKSHTGWPKKVSRCQESALSPIKTVIKARFFINYECKMSTRI